MVLAFFAGIIRTDIERVKHSRLARSDKALQRVDDVRRVASKFFEQFRLVFEFNDSKFVVFAALFDQIDRRLDHRIEFRAH